MADSGHKNLGPASKPNEYLKTSREEKQSEKWKGRGRRGRRRRPRRRRRRRRKVSFHKGLTLAGGVEESFRGYLGHT